MKSIPTLVVTADSLGRVSFHLVIPPSLLHRVSINENHGLSHCIRRMASLRSRNLLNSGPPYNFKQQRHNTAVLTRLLFNKHLQTEISHQTGILQFTTAILFNLASFLDRDTVHMRSASEPYLNIGMRYQLTAMSTFFIV